ncbi:MAG: hypothetical protein PF481_04995 [Bacteroidales bacterium]|jgi:hypothetical protein|nr:hypothetical protein [Bacteroidales bacterium]
MRISPIIFLFVSLTTQSQVFYHTDFESQSVGTAYERLIWQADGFNTDTWDNGLADRTEVDNSTSISGNRSLKITYPAGGYGPSETGSQIKLLFEPQQEVYMSYNLRFSENFTWGTTSYGGKLPGLAGGDNCSGGSSCDGTNGFSARFMWRTGGAAVLYLYHMDKPETYGEDIPLMWPDNTQVMFEKGNWYHIMQRVKINTDGSTYDGEVQVWINGVEVLNLNGLRFTNNGDMVDNFYLSTFHGGADASWAPTETCHTWLDDITISNAMNDVTFKTCEGPKLGANTSLCGTSSVTLDAHVPETNASFQWYKDGGILTAAENATYTTSESGTFVVAYDSLGCYRKDTITVASNLNPNLGADREICASSFETLNAMDVGAGYSYAWEKDAVVIEGATESTYGAYQAGTYEVTVSANGCSDATSSVVLTTGFLDVPDVIGAENDIVTVTVNETGTNFGWYATEDGTSSLGTGATYDATVGATDSYLYVQDLDGFTDLVGKKNAPISYTDTRFERRMKFETFTSLTIDSITVYAVADQDIKISILAADEVTEVATKTFAASLAGELRLGLDFEITTPGIYYMTAEGTTGSLRYSYEADADISFPYTIPGKISILGSNLTWIDAKPYYLFFYKWRVSAGNTCARTPVQIASTESSSALTQNIELTVGWNIMSTSVHIADSSISQIFSGLDVAVVKNNDGFWKNGQVNELNSLHTMTAGAGYLIFMNTAGTLEITGNSIETTNYPTLQSSWNLVGYPSAGESSLETKLIADYYNSENCSIIKNFDGFWEPGNPLNSIQKLSPGAGYFVKKN